jgi:hypothetical protein
VQPWRRLVEVEVGPERVDHPFPVQDPPGYQGQHLDQCGRLPPAPFGGRYPATVDDHLEAAQQRDPDVHHTASPRGC